MEMNGGHERPGALGVVFGDVSATFTDGHGLALERVPSGTAAAPAADSVPERRMRGRAGRAGRATGPLVGRGEQLRLVRGAVRGRSVIAFTGECGSGKTALLRAAAPDLYLRVGGTAFEDFLHDLVREFYVYPPGARRLSEEECTRALSRIGVVVALDDVAYSPEQMAALRCALAGCAVLVGAARSVTGPGGASYGLPGLTEADAFALLARELGRFLPESELPGVRELVVAVRGRPRALRMAAALVRYDGRGFDELARQVAAGPEVLDELAIATLIPQAKRVLAALTLLGGALLPARLVAAMAGVAYSAQEFESLLDRGLAERREDRFGVPERRSEPYRQMLDGFVDLGASLRALTDWLTARDPGGEGTRDAAEAGLTLLGLAAEQSLWDAMLRLTTAVEPVLFLHGHWRAYSRALGHGRAAARQAEDAAAEAYFAHQQGILLFLEGRGEAAGQELTRALDLRTALGDEAGAELTRANLAFVAPEPAGPAEGGWSVHGRRVLAAAGAMAAVLLLGVGLGVNVGGDGHGGSSASTGSALPGADSALPLPRSGGRSGATPDGSFEGSPDGSTPPTPTGTGSTSAPGDTGKPVGAPELKPPLITGAADYGEVQANSADQPVVRFSVINPNDRPLRLADVALSGSTDFRLVHDACPGGDLRSRPLAPGAACTVSVQFTPTALGLRTGNLTASFGGRTAVADLHGNGFAVIEVAITPDEDGVLPGKVDVTADGVTTVCQQATCTVRYYDQDGPLVLSAHGTDGDYDAHWSGDGCPGFSGSECTPAAGGNISASVRFTTHLILPGLT